MSSEAQVLAPVGPDAKCQQFIPPVWPKTDLPSVFLAGSIEMGKAINWQHAVTMSLADLPVAIFNPRRGGWDAGWVQHIDNPQFKEQVDWEMDHLDKASVIIVNFQPGTMSPISLLELGLYAASRKVIVCCPEGFWRRGNVQIVCQRYQIPLYDTIDDMIVEVRDRLSKLCNK